jgi:hypothetical protein
MPAAGVGILPAKTRGIVICVASKIVDSPINAIMNVEVFLRTNHCTYVTVIEPTLSNGLIY